MAIYILSDKRVEGATNLPVIKIEYLNPTIPTECFDAIIFTSKNGVKAIDKIFPDWKNLPTFVVGDATASEVLKLGGKVLLQSREGNGSSLCDDIYKDYPDYCFLYPSPKITAFDIRGFLESKSVRVEQIVMYETLCNAECLISPEENSIIIFSSPSTIECFFKKFTWSDNYKAIVIGKTTASHMPTSIPYEISSEHSLKSAVELAKRIVAQNHP